MRTIPALLLLAAVVAPVAGHAHPRGLYDTQQEAAQRARELGCEGTHLNRDKWMPCRNEAELHRYLRHP